MKVLMINGSPRPDGNTSIALAEMEKTLAEEGVEVETVQVGNKDIRGCIACSKCAELGKCVFDDLVNEVAPKLAEADGLVVGHARVLRERQRHANRLSRQVVLLHGKCGQDHEGRLRRGRGASRRYRGHLGRGEQVLRHFGHAHRVGSVLERRIWPREGRGGSRCRGPAADAHART